MPISETPQQESPLELAVAFVRWDYESVEDERWVAVVLVGGEEFRVYVDTAVLEVTPSGCAKRSRFKWEDYMLENVGGDVARAAMLCAVAVALQT